MWLYEKKLEFPVKVSGPNPKLAKIVIEQYGGADGELAASLRYLSQRYAMPTGVVKGILNDVGTEELAHFEVVGATVFKLLEGATIEDIKAAGLDAYYVDHGVNLYPANSAGVPWTAAYIASNDDPIACLNEDLAAEQKARAVYEYIINLSDDPLVNETMSFLREREVVHYQRFGEALRHIYEYFENRGYSAEEWARKEGIYRRKETIQQDATEQKKIIRDVTDSLDRRKTY
jgi:spore coat protein JC